MVGFLFLMHIAYASINLNSNCQLKTTQPLMTIKSIVESAWAEDMRQFLYHLEPDTSLEKKN